MVIKHPCKLCKKSVGARHKAIKCDLCNLWVHIKCNFLDNKTYKSLQENDNSWYCIVCSKESIPYSSLSEQDFMQTVQGKNKINPNFPDSTLRLNPSWSDSDLYKTLNNVQDENDSNESNYSMYYNIEDINSIENLNKKNQSYFHLNISSLQYHIDDLKLLLSQMNIEFDVIGITESRLQNNQPKTNIEIPGYCYEHTPTKASKGGALLYISKNVNYKPRKDLTIIKDKELESIFIEIVIPQKKNIIVGCIYRHPCMDPHEFNNIYLNPLLEKFSFEKKSVVLLGDFNINLLNCDTNQDSSDFLDLMTSNSFAPGITKPTRITGHSKTLIDNIFFNEIYDGIVTGNITASISDHLPQFMLITQNIQTTKKQEIFRRNYKNFDQENFTLDLIGIDWKKHLQIDKNDANKSMETFLNIFETLLDRYAPLRKLNTKEIRQKQKPWVTKGIIKSIQTRNHLHKKWINAKDPDKKSSYETRFKLYRGHISNLIKISKEEHYKRYFNQNKLNLKNTWKGIKSIIGKKTVSASSPNCIVSNNVTITTPKEIATSFNEYFANVATKVKLKIPPTNRSHLDFLKDPINESIFLQEVTDNEVSNIINTLDHHKATGPASIPTRILITMKDIISKPLANVINLSFSSGKFPDVLKKASVVPIHKGNSKLDCCNYRPISLLSNIGKVIEKLMHTRITKFLNKHKCFFPSQYGFRSKHSINHALIEITEKIRDALDNNSFACAVFVDLQKAFDTVSHKILLEKLQHYGVRGVANNWLKSYLCQRQQSVKIDNSDSTNLKILYGVPQGSVLGPLLFLIYINDLHNAIKFSDTHHFADDTNLLYTNKSLKKVNKHINHDLNHLCHWLRANEISLNTKKTEIIIFRSKNKNITKKLNFRLSGQKIILSKSIKYLGINLDEHLTWSNHINILASKLSRANGILSKIRHFVPYKCLLTIYYALFNSHLTFGSQVWCQGTNENIKRITALQNKAIRIINFKPRNYPVNPLYAKSQILKINDYVYSLNCQLIKQYSLDSLPSTFKDYFTETKYIHDHNTKSACTGKYHVQHINTEYGARSVTNKCIHAWNDMQDKIKTDPPDSNKTLQKKIRTYFFDQYTN